MTERTLVEEAIIEAFGARCPDFAEGCPCCDAWAEYDALAASEAARIEAEAEVERLREALEHEQWGVVEGAFARMNAGERNADYTAGITNYGFRLLLQARRTALESRKTEGGRE